MSYAKGREDEWLLSQFPDGFTGYACELGAVDGTFISCTKLLEERGWTCLCIEPNPIHQEALRASRRLVLTCACDEKPATRRDFVWCKTTPGLTLGALGDSANRDMSVWGQSQVTVLTLDQCLMVSNFPRLDVLVLDVDGLEEFILLGFDIDRWKPKAVIIEYDLPQRVAPFIQRGYTRAGTGSDGNVYLLAP